MASTPRRTIDPVYLQDMSCPICGQDALQLKAMERYPDYVTCGSCESQFVLEADGERVMYGKIPASYPLTRRFALQQWVWPEAIARRAAEERPAAAAGLETRAPAPPTGPTEPPPSPDLEAAGTSAPLAGELAPPEQEDTEAPEESDRPTWSDQEPDDELAELKALLDEAGATGESEADEEDELEPPWAPEMPTEMAAEAIDEGPETLEVSEDQGTGSTKEGEAPAELEWEQHATEWAEPADVDAFDWSDELTDAAENSQPGGEGAEEPSFDYGLKDAEPAAASTSPDQATEDESGEQPEGTAPESEDWFFAKPGEPESPTDFEDDFAADVFGMDEPIESEEPDLTPSDDTSTAPPFADEFSETENSDLLPGETEPAPAMPDWLQPSEEPSELAPELSPGHEAADEASNLLDSLWGEPEQASKSEDEFGGDLAADLGALAGAVASEHEGPEPADEFDLWESEDQAGGSMEQAEPSAEQVERVSPFEEAVDETPLDLGAGMVEEGPRPSEQEIAEVYWAGEVRHEAAATDEGAGPEGGPARLEPQEPEPGIRYRVVMASPDVEIPDDMCAHCNRTQTISKLPINATVFQGAGLGERQALTYRVPLCANCTERAYARSEEQQTARLQAHLISVLVAMLLVVGALATRLVDFQESIGLDLAILLLLAGMGYIVPAAFLLIRASRFPQPEDSKFVETTLRVPADTEGSETAFEWRNQAYARHFVSANQEQAVSGAMRVHEREYEAP